MAVNLRIPQCISDPASELTRRVYESRSCWSRAEFPLLQFMAAGVVVIIIIEIYISFLIKNGYKSN